MKILRKTGLALLPAVLVLVPLSACGGGSGSGPGGQRNAPSAITVLADSSLKSAFTKMGKQLEAQNPGSTVAFTFGASAALAQQAANNDPGDVLATADQQSMNSAEKAQLTSPSTFARKGGQQCQITTLIQSKNTALSKQFITLVTSPSGQKTLLQAGFGPP